MKLETPARFCCAVLLLVACMVAVAPGEALLRLEGQSLSGKPIVLPEDAHGKIALLVIGFTQKGGHATGAWEQRFRKDFGADQRYAVYPVAELEDAPRLLRGMITGSIRRGTPPAEQDRFLILFQSEAELRRFVAFSSPDDAYLLLLDSNGQVKWRGHGLFREEDYSALQDAARKLAPQ
jgi:hypothetical protein